MDLSKTQLIESVFAGGGEMAGRMRALDWSTTALGPVEQWPMSLRACLGIVLASAYPMLTQWGPGYIMLYNDSFAPILGKKHPSALGRGIREVFPETWAFAEPLLDKVAKQGQEAILLTDQLIIFNRNNYLEEVYFTWSYSPVPDDNHKVGGVLSTVLETTERVLEGRRRHLLRDLASRTAGARSEEEVWRITAETLGQDRLSLPFAFLYEYRASEYQAYLAAASIETDEALHPPVIDCHGESLWRLSPALTREGIVVELGDLASRVSVPNWPGPPKEASVVPIRLGEFSEALGFLVAGIHPGRPFDDAYRQFVHRITEQITIGLASARAYEQERQRAESLAELDRAKTKFFSNVSHEFRTPLTLMLGPLEELLPEARERLSPERHEQLATVHRNALRLLKLVNALLDFSRIEAGRVQASYRPTDLARFTSEIASMFRSAMDNAGLKFSVECQPIAEPVYVDRDMWEKVVVNLLSNAFKFTFEGEVAVTQKSVDGTVELQVRDTGVGIPKEHCEQVFERFHRIESTRGRTHEGTGIGLALVQELVKLHSGSVRVESAVGVGSTFTVTIPGGKEHLPAERIHTAQSFASTKIRAEAYVEEAQQWLGDESGAAVDVSMLGKSALLTSSSGPGPAKRELIILADDNADMRRYLLHMLADRYEVQAVADGRQALEAARLLHPALVLTDVMMPSLDGFGLLRAIRDDSALAGTPVILLSARAGEEERVEGLRADADDYLVKPFTQRELLARVATHIKMARLRHETAEREQRLRSEAELEREKLRLSEERLVETSRLYGELQNREAKIRRLVDANILGVTTWNVEGAILASNEAFLRMVQYDHEDVAAGRVQWLDMTPADWRERVERALAEVIQTGTVQPFESEVFRKDGSRVPILVAAALFEEHGHEGVAFALDLTEHKRAEAEIRVLKDQLYKENLALRDEVERTKRAKAELKRAYDSFDEAQRLSKTGSFISDLLADEHTWSDEARRIFEFDSAAKITVQTFRDRIHPEDLPSIDAVIARGMAGVNVNFTFRIVTSRGAVKHVRGIARVVEQIAGRPLFCGALQDVTEIEVAEEALNSARSELAHITRVTTLNALTASIAHEINQPLSGILSNASASLRFLAGDAPDLEEVREAVRDIVRDGKRASEIITRIRGLTKKTAAPREKLDLNETISEVLALIGDEAKRNSVIVRTKFTDDLSPVAGDRVQLQQVVLNLVMNAIQAMSGVSERPRELIISTRDVDADCVQATVEDSGTGIAPDIVDKIFDSFYTTKPGGMGMGLSITRSILQSHGGRLWAVGKDAPGSMFHFTVRKYQEEAARERAAET